MDQDGLTMSRDKPRLHFIGICGKAMGGIAASLARDHWHVTGSDENMYAPMSDYLRQCGIRVAAPYAAANLPDETELVIVGKRVAAGNPELLQVIRKGIAHCSFPTFLRDYFL